MLFLFISFILSYIDGFNDVDLKKIDLYSILGVKQSSSSKDIIKAYKRFLVRKQRFLNTQGNTTSLDQISDKTLFLWNQTEFANMILSDSTSKQLYDIYGFKFLNQTDFSIYGYQSEFYVLYYKSVYGQDLNPFPGIIIYPLYLPLSDAMNGGKKVVKVIQTVPCHCPRGGSRCAKCRKSQFMTQAVKHSIDIPPGAPNGFRIYVKDLGDSSSAHGASDIMFILNFRNQKVVDPFESENSDKNALNFRRVTPYSSDILVEKRITLAQALNGGDIEIENINGETVSLSIDGGVQHNQEKIVIGKGLTVFEENKKRGNLIVRFLIEFPDGLTAEQKSVIADILPEDVDQYQ